MIQSDSENEREKVRERERKWERERESERERVRETEKQTDKESERKLLPLLTFIVYILYLGQNWHRPSNRFIFYQFILLVDCVFDQIRSTLNETGERRSEYRKMSGSING